MPSSGWTRAAGSVTVSAPPSLALAVVTACALRLAAPAVPAGAAAMRVRAAREEDRGGQGAAPGVVRVPARVRTHGLRGPGCRCRPGRSEHSWSRPCCPHGQCNGPVPLNAACTTTPANTDPAATSRAGGEAGRPPVARTPRPDDDPAAAHHAGRERGVQAPAVALMLPCVAPRRHRAGRGRRAPDPARWSCVDAWARRRDTARRCQQVATVPAIARAASGVGPSRRAVAKAHRSTTDQATKACRAVQRVRSPPGRGGGRRSAGQVPGEARIGVGVGVGRWELVGGVVEGVGRRRVGFAQG